MPYYGARRRRSYRARGYQGRRPTSVYRRVTKVYDYKYPGRRRTILRGRSDVPVPRNIGTILPERMYQKLVFNYDHSLSATSTNYTEFVISGNNIYNPDPQSLSDSVAGFNQNYPYYLHWVVLASRATCKFFPQFLPTDEGGEGRDVMAVNLIPTRSNAVAGSDIEDISEQPWSKSRTIQSVVSPNPSEMSNYMSTARMYGLDPISVRVGSATGFTGNGTNPPAVQWYWHFGAQSLPGWGVDVWCRFRVEYYCLWYGRSTAIRA